MYCSVCHTHLCGDCVAKHFSDKSKIHNVVPIEQFLSTLKCPTHPTKQCELHCEQCDIPICTSCISSGKHIGHKQVDIFEDLESKKEVLRRDLQELEKSIFPKYQESAAIIKTQKTDQSKHSQKLTAELKKQGEALHKKINTIIQKKQSEIDDMNTQHLAAIEKQEDVVNKTLHEMKQVIRDLKSLLDTSDVGLVSKYRSRIAEFRKLPQDIAATRSGRLVFTDEDDRSINLVSGTQIQTLITLQGWISLGLCSASTGDVLVTMRSDDEKETKVVRYSGSTEKQSIQWDDQGNPLYSSSSYDKCLSENRNLDICVADTCARAVVVVSAAGKLRFRYTGPPSTPRESFSPRGITSDNQGNILTADCDNHRIHIIDQDGHFLRFIHNCGLQFPWGLCVDSQDNLFVAENTTGKVKKVQYYK